MTIQILLLLACVAGVALGVGLAILFGQRTVAVQTTVQWPEHLAREIASLLAVEEHAREQFAAPQLTVRKAPLCEVCRKAANPVRTHDGHYRCATHKSG